MDDRKVVGSVSAIAPDGMSSTALDVDVNVCALDMNGTVTVKCFGP